MSLYLKRCQYKKQVVNTSNEDIFLNLTWLTLCKNKLFHKYYPYFDSFSNMLQNGKKILFWFWGGEKSQRISQHLSPPSLPNLFTSPGVAVSTWQTPKSQRCRKLLCQGEHVIHLFSPTCLFFRDAVSFIPCLFTFLSFSMSAQTSLSMVFKQSETLWFG